MTGVLESLERFGGEVLVGLSLVLLAGALVVRCLRSPLHRHQVALLTIVTAGLGFVLLFLPLHRPARAWRAAFLQPERTESQPIPVAEDWPTGTTVDPAAEATTAPADSADLDALVELDPIAVGGDLAPSIPATLELDAARAERANGATANASTDAGTGFAPLRRLLVGRTVLVLLLVGSLAFAARLLASWWVLTRLVGRSTSAPDWVDDLQDRCPANERMRIRVSDAVRRPFCAGLRRGVVVLPADLVDARRPRRVEAVLRHEAAHLELGHTRARAVAAAAAPVLYWNPLYWWLCAAMRNSAELLADDRAVVALDRRTYVEELLALAERSHLPSRSVVFGLGVIGPRSDFLSRMESLLMRSNPLAHRSSRTHTTLRNALACVVLGTVSLALGRPAQSITGTDDPLVTGQADTDTMPDAVLGWLSSASGSTQSTSPTATSNGPGTAKLQFVVEDEAALGRLLLSTGGGDVALAPGSGGHVAEGTLTLHGASSDFVQELTEIEGLLLIAYKPMRPQAGNPSSTAANRSLHDEVVELRRRVDRLTQLCVQMHDNQKDLTTLIGRMRSADRPATTGGSGGGRGPFGGAIRPGGGGADTVVGVPVVNGTVIQVQGVPTQPEAVLIDRGPEDGVVPGMRLEVYSGSIYKGQLNVVDLVEGVSVCRPTQVVEGQELVTGDKVTSRL